jgi:hypothetical protein
LRIIKGNKVVFIREERYGWLSFDPKLHSPAILPSVEIF